MSTDTDSTKLRFAVIGCGSLAQAQHLPNIVQSAKAALHTCCDVSSDALTICREKFRARNLTSDYHAAIAEPEVQAICIATTEKLRLPLIEAAAKAGKPVYCEKPLAASMDEARRIAAIVNQSGIPFFVGHNRRCSPAMVDAQAIFRRHMTCPALCPWRWKREGDELPVLPEDGTGGIAVRINDDWHSWKKWLFGPGYEHGPLLFEFTHFYDICNWFLAARPMEVTAVKSGHLLHSAIVKYATGEMATLSCCANGTFGYGKELYEAMGNGGYVAVDHMVEVRTAGIGDAPPRRSYPLLNDRHPEIGREGGISGWVAKKRAACQEAAARHNPLLQFAAEPDKGHARCIDAFVDQIRGRRGPICSVDDALLATQVGLAAVKSAREQRTVGLEEIDQ